MNFPITRYWLLLVSMLLCIDTVYAQPSIGLRHTDESLPFGRQTYYFEDATSTLAIADIVSPVCEAGFRPYTQDVPNFRGTASAYWMKFRVQVEEAGQYYVEVGTAFMDSISLYHVGPDGGVLSVQYGGDDLPFFRRDIKTTTYFFPLDAAPKGVPQLYYIRIKSTQPLFFPLKVGTLKSFTTYQHDLDFVQGIYFGFMLLIFIYNLFLFFTIREKLYLFYVSYVCSITLFMAAIFGYSFEYLWPHHPWLNQQVVIFSGFTLITATFFTQHFLSTRRTALTLHRISHVFALAGLAVVILVATGFKIEGLVLAQISLLVMALYFMFLGVFYIIRGYRPAKFYLSAWGCLVIGIFFGMLESFDVIPVVKYLNPMQMGSAAEVVLLSFALGERINAYKRQKEQAQQMALITAQEHQQLVARQNELLEERIRERTRKISAQNTELVQLNEDKNTLISVVAHDLRSPLTHIKAFLHLLKLTYPDIDIDKNEYFQGMVDASHRMNDMITRVLDINAIEARDIKLEIETIDITEVVRYVEKHAYFEADPKDIQVVGHVEPTQVYAKIDRGYLIQVLENLIGNAVKFSSRGSRIFLMLRAANGFLDIEVKDEGPGISEADQRNLFVQFKTLSAKPTEGELSTGLGLSIVKKYVEAMQGSIRCESTLGKGTSFIVTFPTVSAGVTITA